MSPYANVGFIEAGQVNNAELDDALMNEPKGDSPDWLLTGIVGCSIDGIEHPETLFGCGGKAGFFSPKPGAGDNFIEFGLEIVLDILIGLRYDGAIFFEISGDGGLVFERDFGSFSDEGGGLLS